MTKLYLSLSIPKSLYLNMFSFRTMEFCFSFLRPLSVETLDGFGDHRRRRKAADQRSLSHYLLRLRINGILASQNFHSEKNGWVEVRIHSAKLSITVYLMSLMDEG